MNEKTRLVAEIAARFIVSQMSSPSFIMYMVGVSGEVMDEKQIDEHLRDALQVVNHAEKLVSDEALAQVRQELAEYD